MTGRYTHIYTCNLDVGRQLLDQLGVSFSGEPGLHIFKARCFDTEGRLNEEKHVVYTGQDVQECQYGRSRVDSEGRRYDLAHGGQAFYYKLLHEMRDEMLMVTEEEIPPDKDMNVGVE